MALLAVMTFESLFRERRDRLVRLAVGLCGDRAVAEELVQDAFAELSRRWDTGRRPRRLPAGLGGQPMPRTYRRWLGAPGSLRPLPATPPLVDHRSRADEVWALLLRLSPRRRAALVLRLLRGPVDRRDRCRC